MTISEDLKEFLRLAKRGGANATCSPAEYGARVLANDVLEHVFDFDDRVLRGLATFIGVAKVMPAKAAKLLD